jgi:hypothetical protein
VCGVLDVKGGYGVWEVGIKERMRGVNIIKVYDKHL